MALAQGSKVAGGCSFYRSRKKQFQRHLYLLGLPKEGAPHLFNIVRLACHVTAAMSHGLLH